VLPVLGSQRADLGELFAGGHDGQCHERITRAVVGRRPVDADGQIGQGWRDLAPAPVGVRNQSSVCGNVPGNGQKQLRACHGKLRCIARIDDQHAIKADTNAHDGAHAIAHAFGALFGSHGSGGVGDVRSRHADAGAEKPEAAAGSDGFDDGRLPAAAATERFGHRGRERKQGGRADNADEVAGLRVQGQAADQQQHASARSRCVHRIPPRRQRAAYCIGSRDVGCACLVCNRQVRFCSSSAHRVAPVQELLLPFPIRGSCR
jgi:hypothetical protein